ncbi:conserved hypothetical protein [Vibrio coralliirubri]|nr:conserved hypothetical protein [Vibrio coralliirubri]
MYKLCGCTHNGDPTQLLHKVIYMADDYNVYQGSDGVWRGKKQDASRASVTAKTQQEAFEKTRDLAKKAQSEVSIHRGDNGKIRVKHSYGNDPSSTKG